MNEDAIDRKLVCAFIAGLISDETERKKALEYINELPSVNPTKTGWIPVSERLPEEDGLYLVYTEEQPFVCSFKDGEFFIDEVLEWMPLPNHMSHRKVRARHDSRRNQPHKICGLLSNV